MTEIIDVSATEITNEKKDQGVIFSEETITKALKLLKKDKATYAAVKMIFDQLNNKDLYITGESERPSGIYKDCNYPDIILIKDSNDDRFVAMYQLGQLIMTKKKENE